ncbi:MAG: hypothetical protein WC894_04430 [Patescibacteria group bacterium]
MAKTKNHINIIQLIYSIGFLIIALAIGYYLVIYSSIQKEKETPVINPAMIVPTILTPTVKLIESPISVIPSNNNKAQILKNEEIERIDSQIELWLKQQKDEIEFEKTLIQNAKDCETWMKEGKVDYRACEIILKSVSDSHKIVEEIGEKIDKLELQRATIISGL